MADHRQERNPTLFFMLTFLFSWGIWLPSILSGLGIDLGIDAEAYTAITIPIGAFAPMAAAIVLVVRKHGWKEAWNFLRQAFDFKVKPIILVSAIVIPLLIHAIAHYLSPVLGFEVADTLIPDNISISPLVLAVPYFILMLLIGGGQEEFGWRGYAQDPLQERFGPIPASLMIGAIWGLWHLPLWIMPGDDHSTYSYIAFVLMTTSISLVYTWLYNLSGKKLIVPLIFHAMCNTAAPLLPFLLWEEGKPENAYWVYAGVNVFSGLIAAYLIKRKDKTT